MSTLINPTRPKPQSELDFVPEPVYMKHPITGMIFKLTHKDTILRCQRELYLPSSEAEMREQAIELADLQGRPRPKFASKAAATSAGA